MVEGEASKDEASDRRSTVLGRTYIYILVFVALSAVNPREAWCVDGGIGDNSTGSATISLVVPRRLEVRRLESRSAPRETASCLISNGEDSIYQIFVPELGSGNRRLVTNRTADPLHAKDCAPVQLSSFIRRAKDAPVVVFVPTVS